MFARLPDRPGSLGAVFSNSSWRFYACSTLNAAPGARRRTSPHLRPRAPARSLWRRQNSKVVHEETDNGRSHGTSSSFRAAPARTEACISPRCGISGRRGNPPASYNTGLQPTAMSERHRRSKERDTPSDGDSGKEYVPEFDSQQVLRVFQNVSFRG